MALLGTTNPKFIVGATTVQLYNAVLSTSFQEPDIITHKSVLTGFKSYVVKGDYSSFDVLVYLYKYSVPKTKFQEIYAYNHQNCYFYPHADGNAIKDSGGTDVYFHISQMRLEYLDNLNENDILRIRFEAIDYVDIEESLV